MSYILIVTMLFGLFWLNACTNKDEENQERLKELAEWISIRTELYPMLREAGHKNVPIEDDFRVPVFSRLMTHDRTQFVAYVVKSKSYPCNSMSEVDFSTQEYTLFCDDRRHKYIVEKKGIDWYVTAH